MSKLKAVATIIAVFLWVLRVIVSPHAYSSHYFLRSSPSSFCCICLASGICTVLAIAPFMAMFVKIWPFNQPSQ